MRVLHYCLLITLSLSVPAGAHELCAVDNHADTDNEAGNPVRVLKRYEGMWRGWADGCINCEGPMLIDTLPRKTSKKVSKKETSTTAAPATPAPPLAPLVPIRQGYCECRCGTQYSQEAEETATDDKKSMTDADQGTSKDKDKVSEEPAEAKAAEKK